MVHGAYNFLHKIKDYAIPSKEERKCMIKGVLTLSIILLIAEIVRTTIFERTIGLNQILSSAIIFLIASILMILVYETTQRLIVVEQATKTKVSFSKQKTIIGLVSAIISLGAFPILSYKNTIYYLIERHRVGHLFHGKSVNLMAKSVVGATIALTIFASILQIIPFLGNKMAEVTMIYAVSNLLPLPNQDGLPVYYVSRILYFSTLSIAVLIMLIFLII